MCCWIKTSHSLIVSVLGTSVFKLKGKHSSWRWQWSHRFPFCALQGKLSRDAGPELVPFSKGSSSCWFRWWIVNLPQRKALSQLNYMSAAGPDSPSSYTHVWGDGTPAGQGLMEMGLGWQCGWSLRCRAGVGCEQPRAPEVVK